MYLVVACLTYFCHHIYVYTVSGIGGVDLYGELKCIDFAQGKLHVMNQHPVTVNPD